MTDRLSGLTVVFKEDIRSDDAEALINAIRLLQGVADVVGNVSDMKLATARIQVRAEIREQILAILYPKTP